MERLVITITPKGFTRKLTLGDATFTENWERDKSGIYINSGADFEQIPNIPDKIYEAINDLNEDIISEALADYSL